MSAFLFAFISVMDC